MGITTTNKGKSVMAHVTIVLINPVSLEFTVAQSPDHSREMMVGVWYASWEVGATLSFRITSLFDCHNQDICSSFIKAFLLNTLTVFVILAKRYKYYVRENEVKFIR